MRTMGFPSDGGLGKADGYINFKYGYGQTYDFVFTHYPCNNFDDRIFNIHGHEHVAHMYTNTHQHINVNCELHGYKPISAVALAETARKKKEQMTKKSS